MNRVFASAVAVAFAAAIATTPAQAAQYVLAEGYTSTNSFGTIPGSPLTGTFGNTSVTGGFSQTFTFDVAAAGYLNTTTGSAPGNAGANNNVTGFTLRLQGPGGIDETATDTDAGLASLAKLEDILLSIGSYILTVSGTAGLAGSSYSGTYSFAAQGGGPGPGKVPLPGALVLMGSVVLGGAGFARLRKRQRDAVIA